MGPIATVVVVIVTLGSGVVSQNCKCTPTDSCWPSQDTWNALNASISGGLLLNTPPAAPCYAGADQNAEECAKVYSQWTNSTFQSLQPIGYSYPLDGECPPLDLASDLSKGTCGLGPSPVYTVNATEPEQLAKGILFAKEHNIRLVVRNTGHDILGKSMGYGSLQIWMKYIQKGITYQENYVASDQCTQSDWTGSAFTIGGGYVWSDIYAEAFRRNLVVVGGGDPTVGCVGGFVQGGGHSPASHDYGLAADQVLEAQVVLANGKTVTANACQNSDLFFAIRGGGGGTYGVVVSTTVKAYPSTSVAAQSLTIAPMGSDTDALLDAIADIHASYPSLVDAGFSGYGSWSIASPVALFGNITVGYVHAIAMMGKTLAEAQAASDSLLTKLGEYNGTSLSVSVTWMHFPTYSQYYNTLSGVHQPVGTGNTALASRMFDKPSLTQRPTMLRQMLKSIAGTVDQYTINSLLLVGGGQIFADVADPFSGVNPAWRETYLLNIVARGWADDSDAATAQAIQDDITYNKTGAMRLVAPSTGGYMNEGDRNDPLWATDFYGRQYSRLSVIKNKYDPETVFYCPTCVGSELWYETDIPGKEYGRLCRKKM